MTQNRIWCAIVVLANELLAWMQLLAFATDPTTDMSEPVEPVEPPNANSNSAIRNPRGSHPARRWEPKRLRHRLFTTPAALTHHARATTLRFSDRHPWATLITSALTVLRAYPTPG